MLVLGGGAAGGGVSVRITIILVLHVVCLSTSHVQIVVIVAAVVGLVARLLSRSWPSTPLLIPCLPLWPTPLYMTPLLYHKYRHRPGHRRRRCGWACVPGALPPQDGIRFGISGDIPGHRHARVAYSTAIMADVCLCLIDGHSRFVLG